MPTSAVATSSSSDGGFPASSITRDQSAELRKLAGRATGEGAVVLRLAIVPEVVLTDGVNRGPHRDPGGEVERLERLHLGEALARELLEHCVDEDDHAVDGEHPALHLVEHLRLRDEHLESVAGPLQQPLGPVLPAVARQHDALRRVLGREPHQVVTPVDVVIQPGHAHAEVFGDGFHGDVVEPDLGRGPSDHLAIEASGPTDLSPGHSRRHGRGG